MNIEFLEIEPIYTGGGIYLFEGKLITSRYFIACDDMNDFMVVDADPRLSEESDMPEWQEKHLIEYIDCTKTDAIFLKLYTWLKINKPNCGIDFDRAIEKLNSSFMKLKYLSTSTNEESGIEIEEHLFTCGFYQIEVSEHTTGSGKAYKIFNVSKLKNAPAFLPEIEFNMLNDMKFNINTSGYGYLDTNKARLLMASYNHAIEVVDILNKELI